MSFLQEINFFLSPVVKNFPGKKIIMLHHGRCGSTVLTNMLHEYPAVEWQGEAFKQGRRPKNIQSVEAFYSALGNYPVNRKSKQFGFEIKPMHLESFSVGVDELINFCEQQSFTHYIVLTRKNILRKLISSDIGKATKKWHFKPNSALEKEKISLSTDPGDELYIQKRLASLAQEVSIIESIKPCALHLKYEDDIRDDPSVGFRKLQDFLQLPAKAIAPSLRRVNPEPVSELLSNFEAVAEVLEHTPYQWMLYD